MSSPANSQIMAYSGDFLFSDPFKSGQNPLDLSRSVYGCGAVRFSYLEWSRRGGAAAVMFSKMNHSTNKTSSQGPETFESINFPMARLPLGSCFGTPKGSGGITNIQFSDQNIVIKGESAVPSITKADVELLAKNRGNVMLRYKEKKKTRRYINMVSDLISLQSCIFNCPKEAKVGILERYLMVVEN